MFFKETWFHSIETKKIRKNSGKKNGVCFLNESPSCFRTDLTDLRQEVAHLPNAGREKTVGIEQKMAVFSVGVPGNQKFQITHDSQPAR